MGSFFLKKTTRKIKFQQQWEEKQSILNYNKYTLFKIIKIKFTHIQSIINKS